LRLDDAKKEKKKEYNTTRQQKINPDCKTHEPKDENLMKELDMMTKKIRKVKKWL
jgi:hypothetical protein